MLKRIGNNEPYRYELWRNGVLENNNLDYFKTLVEYRDYHMKLKYKPLKFKL